MDPVRIGAVIPSGMGTPAQYLTVGDQDQPVMRVDLYGHSDESYTLTDVIIWQGLLVVGWGWGAGQIVEVRKMLQRYMKHNPGADESWEQTEAWVKFSCKM